MAEAAAMSKARIAHFAGQTATIQNTPPLVTSNKARAKYGLPLRPNPDGSPAWFDVLRAQRIATPVTVYVEQFSAHPLESDAAELYAPPDGYIDPNGVFHRERQGPADTAVYEIELRPEDGYYPLPYVARQADGSAWETEEAFPGAPPERARQSFFPDGSRSFEEIDRLHVGDRGVGNLISDKAEVSFYRVLPPGGYTKGLAAARRTDVGDGDIAPERRAYDFFPYRPRVFRASAPRPGLARAVNIVQRVLGGGGFDGAIWTEGSPAIEEMLYWLHLLIDTTVPICGNSAQRPMGQISNDGPKNLVDSVDYIASRVWSDVDGRNEIGAVMITEQRVFAARSVAKVDARPGGYEAVGGHGGILGAVGGSGHGGPPVIHYVPKLRHTYRSDVNITRLPSSVDGVRRGATGIKTVSVTIKDEHGLLVEGAIPKVVISKEASYGADDSGLDLDHEVDLVALIDRMLIAAPLAGFVFEGLSPYGTIPGSSRRVLGLRAVYSGFPVVTVGRGNTGGFATPLPPFIAGSNLTSTKARLLLIASLLKLGALPVASDPDRPTADELARTRAKVDAYQAIFDTH